MSPSTYPSGVTNANGNRNAHPKYGKYHVSNNNDDDDDDDDEPTDGQYRCLTCESVTEIENEHAKNATNWCGDCEELRTFSRVDTDE